MAMESIMDKMWSSSHKSDIFKQISSSNKNISKEKEHVQAVYYKNKEKITTRMMSKIKASQHKLCFKSQRSPFHDNWHLNVSFNER